MEISDMQSSERYKNVMKIGGEVAGA